MFATRRKSDGFLLGIQGDDSFPAEAQQVTLINNEIRAHGGSSSDYEVIIVPFALQAAYSIFHNQFVAENKTWTQPNLVVTSDKSSIVNDGVDTVIITCDDSAIAGDANIDYEMRGNTVASGTKPVIAGVVTLSFNADTSGLYTFIISRQGETEYEIGVIQIEVTEAA